MSDWVNWQDYAAQQAPEIQRQADAADQARGATQAQMDTALGKLGGEASYAAGHGRFTDVSSLGGYSQMMAARDSSLQSQLPQQQVGAWESELSKGQEQKDNPWDSLGKRLGDMGNRAGQRNTAVNEQARYKAQQQSALDFKRQQEAALAASKRGQSADSNAYTKWSDAVDYNATNRGGMGQSTYADANHGHGPRPVTDRNLSNQPTTKHQLDKERETNARDPETGRAYDDPSSPGAHGWW
jgi:hypothetical protein